MKKTTTTATTTATTLTVTKQGKRVAKSTTTPKQETTTIKPHYTLRKSFDACVSDNNGDGTNALFDYIFSNKIHIAMAKDLCKGLFAKGNETANRLDTNENLPFSLEDMASVGLSAMFETWTDIYDGTFDTWCIESDNNGNLVLPDEMILSAYRAMSHEMYRQGTRVYKWLHIETGDGQTTALNNVQGLVSCISDIETKALFEDLLTDLLPLERYVLKKSLEGFKRADIVAKYAKAHRMSEKTATNRIKYAQRTLREKALNKGIVPLF